MEPSVAGTAAPAPAGHHDERRQFTRLLRMSFGRLMDAAVGSREIAAEYFVIWSAALLLTPPLFYAVMRVSAYPWLRRRSLEALQQFALADRIFFVVWSMLAMLLMVSMLWDALFPDRTDQQVLGVLPVKSRTVAAARLTAALVAGAVFVTAIAVPTAVLYGLAGASHPVIGSITAVMTAHLTATITGGMFVYCALLVVRGLLVTTAGAAIAGKMAVVVQFVAVLLLFEAFMFLPGVVGGVVQQILSGDATWTWAPPLWFIGIYTYVAGPKPAVLAHLVPWAMAAPLAATVLAAVVYVVPARMNARRAVESRESSRRSVILPRLLSLLAVVLLRRPQERAVFRFAVTSVLRNSRPLLAIATALGLGLALAGTRILAARVRDMPLALDRPYDYLVAIPLVLSFALVLGARQALATPTDLGANWLFRLTASGAGTGWRNATAMTLLVLGVVPITLVMALLAAALWAPADVAGVALLHLASGWVLCELLAAGAASLPFTRANGVDPTALKMTGPAALIGLHVFAFRLDDVQLQALQSVSGVAAYLVAACLIVAAIRLAAHWQRRPRELSFEPVTDEAVQLKLSA